VVAALETLEALAQPEGTEMSRGRFSPWPSYVDLFSAFGVVALGAAGFFNVALKSQIERAGTLEGRITRPQKLATELHDRLKERDIPGVRLRECGVPDVCLDFNINFARNDDEIREPDDRRKIQQIAEGLKSFLETAEIPTGETGKTARVRQYAQLVVEGHTDDTQVHAGARERFRFNWNLSARRASSVLFELRRAGVGHPEFNVVAWGAADSKPLRDCAPGDERCREENRRTTIRIRFDPDQAQDAGATPPARGEGSRR
jgi:outer membrane protein OmpA-like peptidoglycan-associated protein